MAIGSAILDRIHGPALTRTLSELADFIMEHLRCEIFMDKDFHRPTKPWILQALVLIEVYEKTYSTRFLHERAVSHHDTTLTLMRRNALLEMYPPLHYTPSLGADGDAELNAELSTAADSDSHNSWPKWIEREVSIRVVLAAFMLDSAHSAMFGHASGISAQDLRLPMPCDEALWSATSASEFARVQSSIHAKGTRPLLFLEALKDTIDDKKVSATVFGRAVIMAGLLSVSSQSVHDEPGPGSLGTPQLPRGSDNIQSALMRAFDSWKRHFDTFPEQSTSLEYGNRAGQSASENSLVQLRDALHCLAHITLRIDITDCLVFSGAAHFATLSAEDCLAVSVRIKRHWATAAASREAAFYAIKVLSGCLLATNGVDSERVCLDHDDFVLGQSWIVFVASLVAWCYGLAVEGPLVSAPALTTTAEQKRDMQKYLQSFVNAESPNDLVVGSRLRGGQC
ncbi:hypothetical protein V2A60_004412 [Cordyceps javanica]